MTTARPTGTVTFLFSDIQGSTQLWERHPEAMKTALARHDALMRRAIEAHGGFVFKTIGDAFCVTFTRATDAMAACLDAQRALQAEPWESTGPIRVRMGLHTGATDERDGDYYGPTVNRVARLMSAGHGAQVLVSQMTCELVRDHLPAGATLRDMGEHRLKDLVRPERIWQLLVPDLASEFPALKTLDQRIHNLPVMRSALVGREREVAQVRETLLKRDVGLLTLTGPGGTGKSSLGLQACAELIDEFDDGVFFVALAPITDPALVASTIAQTLGVREVGSQPVLETLKHFLQDKHALLFLDNFEQVVAAATVVSELLQSCAKLKVLASSRIALRIRGERENPVPPLALPDPKRLPPTDVLARVPAVALFVQRAQDVKPDFALTNENAEAIADICARLDGLPLAIELAAARVKLLPPAAMRKRLESRLSILTGGARDLPARQQTLRGAIAWSHDLLDEKEKVLFRRVAVFVGGCTLDAATVVAGDVEIDVLDGIGSLVDKSLLRQEESADGDARFSMLQTICEFGRECLKESGEEAATRDRHRDFFLALAGEAEPNLKSAKQREWLERLDFEHDNLRAALDWSHADASAASLHELRGAGSLWYFWATRGYFAEGRAWLESALARDQSHADARTAESRSLRAKALNALCLVTYFQGGYTRILPIADEALAFARDAGDDANTAFALANIGFAANHHGAAARAVEANAEGLALARRIGNRWLTAFALNTTAIATQLRGEPSREIWKEATSVFKETGDRYWGTYTKIGFGFVTQAEGDFAGSEPSFRESLETARELRNLRGIALSLAGLAGVRAAQGDTLAAARLFCASEALREAIQSPIPRIYGPVHEANEARARAAGASLAAGDFDRAWAEGRAMPLEQAIDLALGGVSK
ncbi:MAG: adenylate/guanylate cyclase domain-containing protein [Planctomycetes bacterium]|nr:adenylate/guanylate cyclase domain-containing protein [Planctomycetota bacterium]